MNTTRIAVLVLMATLAGSVESAWALDCDKTFNKTSDDWNVDGNWTPSGKPVSDEVACIPSGKTARIENADAIAAAIDCDGTIEIDNTYELQLTAEDKNALSELAGDIKIEKGGELNINADLTIEGNGGEIIGLSTGGSVPAKILGAGTVTFDGVGALLYQSLVVRGPMELANGCVNDAYVNADSGTLLLTVSTKRGSGTWEASGDGTLQVGIGVSGAATWLMDTSSESTIRITQTITSNLTGDWIIEDGTLKVEQDLTTSGDLTFESVSGSHPRIEVSDTKMAIFSN